MSEIKFSPHVPTPESKPKKVIFTPESGEKVASVPKKPYKVIGVGGGGGNIVSNCVDDDTNYIQFLAADTDHQALSSLSSKVETIVLGGAPTDSAAVYEGAGSDPEVGRQRTELCRDIISERIKDAHVVFIVASMGGGTGTGGAPVVADISRSKEALTIGIATLPFAYEPYGKKALDGLSEFRNAVDALLVISNDNAILGDENCTIAQAYRLVDEKVYDAVMTITNLIELPAFQNQDKNDIMQCLRTDDGEALDVIISTAKAAGEDRIESCLNQIFDFRLQVVPTSAIAHSQLVMVAPMEHSGEENQGIKYREQMVLYDKLAEFRDQHRDTRYFPGLRKEDDSLQPGEISVTLIMALLNRTDDSFLRDSIDLQVNTTPEQNQSDRSDEDEEAIDQLLGGAADLAESGEVAIPKADELYTSMPDSDPADDAPSLQVISDQDSSFKDEPEKLNKEPATLRQGN